MQHSCLLFLTVLEIKCRYPFTKCDNIFANVILTQTHKSYGISKMLAAE